MGDGLLTPPARPAEYTRFFFVSLSDHPLSQVSIYSDLVGLVESESQENLFITHWFAQAKKQRRFSRDVATDVDWILNQGRTLGVRARLHHKLDYLWRSCTGELSEQNDLFRLTYAH